mmetsp:Transcript_956/g.997  ORF Transcript_956/g.997 Transcript_956/m.997 type:complete len:530 (+) Transcript_956:64-1653(+)
MRQLSSTFNAQTYFNPADNYTKSLEVKYGSAISLKEFEISTEYFRYVGTIAGALAVAGLLAVGGLVLGICCRYCFPCCECRPRPMKYDRASHRMISLDREEGSLLADDSDYDEDNEEDEYHYNHLRNYDLYQTYPWNRKRMINVFFLCLFLAASICFDQFFLVGRTNTSRGVDTIHLNFNSFNGIVHHVQNDSDLLVDYGTDLNDEYSKARISCPFVNDPRIASYINDYNSNVQSLQEYVSPLSKNVNDIDEYFNYYAQGSFLFIFWGIFLFIFFLIALFVLFEKRLALQVMTGIGVTVEILFILLGVIFISFVMIFGDLCEKPTYNVLNSLPNSNDIQNIANYYATCQGNTTIQVDLQSAHSYINQMYSALDTFRTLPLCQNDINLIHMQGTVVQINTTLNDLSDVTTCPPIQRIWFDLVNTGVCTEFYSGIFYVWGAQILTSLFFFFTLLVVSINYQFYPKHPYVKERLFQNQNPNHRFFGFRSRMRSSSSESYFNVELPGRGRDSANDVARRNDGSDDDEEGGRRL